MLAVMTSTSGKRLLMMTMLATSLLSPLVSRASKPGANGTQFQEMEISLAKQVKDRHLAGMGAIVVRAEGVVGVAVAGVRKQGESARVQTDDLFHLGSTGKAITATMIARLIESGKLSFDTTPLDVFPELRKTIHPGFRAITINQLLSHHAGLSPYTSPEEFKAVPQLSGNETEQRAQFAVWALQHSPAVTPGTRGLYSNAGYSIAAAMAERITGSSWEELVRLEVFEPLGMHGLYGYPLTAGKDQPWNHRETKRGVQAISQEEAWQVPPCLRPAGDISLSLPDYGKFLRMNLQGLRGTDSPFLSAATVRRLHTSPMQDEYALGWGTFQSDGVRSSTHAGSGGSFYAIVTLQPDRDVSVAVVANSAGERTTEACSKALEAFSARYAILSKDHHALGGMSLYRWEVFRVSILGH